MGRVLNVFNYYLELDKELEDLRDKLRYILSKIGTISIFQLIEIELDIKKDELPKNINIKLLKFYNRIFKCQGFMKYNIDDDQNILSDSDKNKTTIVKYGIFSEKNTEKTDKYLDCD